MSKKKIKKLKKANDSFVNLVSGLGTTKDSSSYTTFLRGKNISLQREFVTALYSQNWLASAVVNVPVNDMTRNWIEIEAESEEKEEALENEISRLKAKEKFNQALKWASAYGGSVIIMMVDDGRDMAEPLTLNAVRSKGVSNLIVLDRWRVTVGPLDTNLLSPNFGKPKHYLVSRNGQQIHHSRILRFDGEVTSLEEFERSGYWGNSVFEKTWQPISNSQTVSLEIAGMTTESNVDVYMIKGLNEMVAMGPEGVTKVTQRVSLAHQLKSNINGIILDSEDSYEKKSNTFSGLAELDDKFLLKVCGARGIPLSKLVGKTDSGLNGNGEGDMKNYYDNINAAQEVDMRDNLQRLLDIVNVSEFGTVEHVEFEFEPLWQMSQEQLATISLSNANRDAVYLDRGVTSTEVIQKQLASDGVYNSISDDISDQDELFGDVSEVTEEDLDMFSGVEV